MTQERLRDAFSLEQHRQDLLEEGLVRLKVECDRSGSASQRRKLQILSSELKPFYFTHAPGIFSVPHLDRYAHGVELGSSSISHPKLGIIDAPIRLPTTSFLRYVLIVGRWGSGKTRGLAKLFIQLLSQPNTHAWLLTPEASLLSVLELVKEGVIVLNPAKNWFLNPLAPIPEASVEENSDDTFQALSAITWLGAKSAAIMLPLIRSLTADIMRGIPRGLADLLRILAHLPGPRNELKDTIQGKVALMDIPFYRSTSSLNMELMAKTNLVINTSRLDTYASQFLINLLLARLIRHRRVATREEFKPSTEQHKLVVLGDEAQRILPGVS